MNTEGERLRQFIESKGVTVRQFCMQNKIDYNGFIQILNGNRQLEMKTIRKVITVYPDLSIDMIVKGSADDTRYSDLNTQNPLEVAEPSGNYGSDPFEKYILSILERPKAQKIIEDVVKKMIK